MHQLHDGGSHSIPDLLLGAVSRCGDRLAVDFGEGRGLWLYSLDSGWKHASTWDPFDMVSDGAGGHLKQVGGFPDGEERLVRNSHGGSLGASLLIKVHMIGLIVSGLRVITDLDRQGARAAAARPRRIRRPYP